MDKEYTEETERSRKLLRPILKLAKGKEEYSRKCKMEDDILIIHGKKYSTKNLHKLPADINGFKASSKESDTALAFFGELNPFSNFNISPFSHDGTNYHSSEQFIQAQNADHFKDIVSKHKIMNTKTPTECKEIAREITNYNNESWREVAKERCKPGIAAKFLNNEHLIKLLKSTRQKKLVEACYDTLWGTGVPLHDNDCLNENKWANIGIQGEILMEIREELENSIDHAPMDVTVGP